MQVRWRGGGERNLGMSDKGGGKEIMQVRWGRDERNRGTFDKGRVKEIRACPIRGGERNRGMSDKGGGGVKEIAPSHFPKSLALSSINNDEPLNIIALPSMNAMRKVNTCEVLVLPV